MTAALEAESVPARQSLNAIHPVDILAVRRRLLRDYVEVREDFFDYEQFVEWCKGRSWVLCCHGGPRSGKSSFAAAIAERLLNPVQAAGDDCDADDIDGDRIDASEDVHAEPQGIAGDLVHDDITPGAFTDGACTQNDQERHPLVLSTFLGHGSDRSITDPTKNLLRSMLRQLLEHNDHSIDLPSNDNAETWRALVKAELNSISEAYLIVDGLDWVIAPEDYKKVKQEIYSLRYLANDCSLRIMLVQSPTEILEPDQFIRGNASCGCQSPLLYWKCQQCDGYMVCQACFDNDERCDSNHTFSEPYETREISIDPQGDAILEYVQQAFEQAAQDEQFSTFMQAQDVIDDVEGTIVAQSEECFLIARTYVDDIIRTQTLEVLEVSDRILSSQVEYYNSLMHEVLRSPDWELALQVLSVVAAASAVGIEKHLTFFELMAAFPDHKLTMPDLLRMTKHFVAIDWAEVPVVKPFHVTAATYLYEESLKIKEFGLSMPELCSQAITQDNACSNYAIRYWPDFDQRLDNLKHWSDSSFRRRAFFALNDQKEPEPFSASHIMHVIAWYGLETAQGDIDVADTVTGETALHIAARRNHLALVKKLLAEGADAKIQDKAGRTALWLAIDCGNRAMTKLLLTETGDTDVSTMGHLLSSSIDMKLDLLQSWAGDVKTLDEHGRTLLFHAKDKATLGYLIDQGIDVNHADHSGFTALNITTLRLADLLKSRGALEKEPQERDLVDADITVLEACRQQRFDILAELEHPDLPIYRGQSAFTMALRSEPIELDYAMAMLGRIRKVPQLHLQELLDYAVETDSVRHVETLVERGASLFKWCDVGKRPSEMAVKVGASQAMQDLISGLETSRLDGAMLNWLPNSKSCHDSESWA